MFLFENGKFEYECVFNIIIICVLTSVNTLKIILHSSKYKPILYCEAKYISEQMSMDASTERMYTEQKKFAYVSALDCQ